MSRDLSPANETAAAASTIAPVLFLDLGFDSGTVRVEDKVLNTMSADELARFRNRNVGFVFQFHHLLPEFSAVENVAMPLMLNGARRREARTAALSWLERLDVADVADRRPGEISGGQQQRVALARALVTEPRVLFADEPTGSLDSLAGEQVLSHLVRLARAQQTKVVLVKQEDNVAG